MKLMNKGKRNFQVAKDTEGYVTFKKNQTLDFANVEMARKLLKMYPNDIVNLEDESNIVKVVEAVVAEKEPFDVDSALLPELKEYAKANGIKVEGTAKEDYKEAIKASL